VVLGCHTCGRRRTSGTSAPAGSCTAQTAWLNKSIPRDKALVGPEPGRSFVNSAVSKQAVRFRPYYTSSAWWISTVPGAAISCLVLSASLLGNWIRDVLDPLRRYRE
jgi:hypothetical protein